MNASCLQRIFILFYIVAVFVHEVLTIYCASNTLPYHVSVRSYGLLIMDCAQITCSNGISHKKSTVIRESDRQKTSSGFTLINVAEQKDGISRSSITRASVTRLYPLPLLQNSKSTSWSTPCIRGRVFFKERNGLQQTRQCSYFGADNVPNIAHKLMHNGERFTGGQVLQGGRLVAFDFISDVRKLRDRVIRSKYLVTMARISCIPELPESSNEVETGVENGLVEKFNKLVEKNPATNSTSPASNGEQEIDKRRGESRSDQSIELISMPRTEPILSPTTAIPKRLSSNSSEDTDESEPLKLIPPPLSNDTSSDTSNSTTSPGVTESLAKNSDSQEKDDSTNCFTSPSGHRCCSRQVETIVKQMSMVVSNEMTEDDNETTIYKAMLRYITKETTKKFCTPFETIISKKEFAAKSHTNGTSEQDGVALGCKMQIKIGGRNRFRRSDDDAFGIDDGHVFLILSYSTVVNANDKNSKSIKFPGHPEPPPPSPSSNNNGNPANSPGNPAPPAAPPVPPPVPPHAVPPLPPRHCFSADGVVETDTGVKRMHELSTNDNVLVADQSLPRYMPVTSFLHRLPKQPALFYQIKTLHGIGIKLTGNHFIYVTDCVDVESRRIYAANVKIGECVFRLDSDRKEFIPTPVVNVTKVWQNGIYSPLTASGTIAVNDILVSCYSSVDGPDGMHQTYLYWIDKVYSWITWSTQPVAMEKFNDEVELAFAAKIVADIVDLLVSQLSASY